MFITTYHVLPEYTSLIVRTRASRAVQELPDLQREGPARCGGTGAARILYRSNRFIDNKKGASLHPMTVSPLALPRVTVYLRLLSGPSRPVFP